MLAFGKKWSTHPHGKVSKCFVIAIYVKNSLASIPPCSRVYVYVCVCVCVSVCVHV